MYKAEILLDSLSSDDIRLTTFEVSFPRFILAEFNTHRMLSRNFASNRAIPVKKIITNILNDPMIPCFGGNNPGMQSTTELTSLQQEKAKELWLSALENNISIVKKLSAEYPNVHKQWANRLLEPFSWVTGIVSATDWANFFALRDHPDAQPEFQIIAKLMHKQYKISIPIKQNFHIPMVSTEERQSFGFELCRQISVGRCCRVSYLNHKGERDFNEDIALHNRLINQRPLHASPFEHQATAELGYNNIYWGNFKGWKQYRKELPKECVKD